MTNIATVVYTALIVFGIIGLTEVAFAWYDIRGRDKTDDEIQEQWCKGLRNHAGGYGWKYREEVMKCNR